MDQPGQLGATARQAEEGVLILTYKYRIKDNSAHKALNQYARAVNQVWNYCNAYQRDIEARYRAGAPKRKWPNRFDFQKLTRGSSAELGINAKTIQVICKRFAASRDKAKHSLKFRSSGGARRALGWIPFDPQARQISGNSITYLGRKFRWFGNDRPLPQTVKGGAFVEDSRGKWWVCFHVEGTELPTGNGAIGIDLGLKTLATLSDGSKINAIESYRKYEAKLAIAQRAGNKRRAKAIHTKIVNTRKDHLHKATCQIAQKFDLIAVGDVNPSKLAKTRMAKSVFDAGWAMFRSHLRYKASRHGAVYLDIDERFTTQTCSCCGTIPASSPKGMSALGIREWECSDCGEIHDRDVNAARNILNLALGAQRPVEESRGIPG